MSSFTDDELRDVLDGAVAALSEGDFVSLYTVAGELRTDLADDDARWPLIWALEYREVPIEDGDRKSQYGRFAPLFELQDGPFPPPVTQVEDGVLEVWARAADLAPWALIRARFSDLLWERRYGDRPVDWAHLAIEAYIAAAGQRWGAATHLRDGLIRALELSARLNDGGLQADATSALVSMARDYLHVDERAPGIVIPILSALAARPPDRRPNELEDLLEQAATVYEDDPWSLQSTLDVMEGLVPPDDRPALHARQVDAFRGFARKATGVGRLMFLERAREIASDHGLRDLADSIRREIEAITPEEMDLKLVSASVEIPAREFDEHVAWLVGADDLEAALTRFGLQLPSGEFNSNREFTSQMARDYPLQNLFPTITLGPENSILRKAETPEEKEELALIEREVLRIQLFAGIAVEVVQAIEDRYGFDEPALVSLFTTDLIEPMVAHRIARAFTLYSGDPDSAASVITPRLERVIRTIVQRSGATVTKSPSSRGPGGVRTLGDLLSELQGRIDESWRRYLRTLLSEVTGLNLRNRVGHGLVDEVARPEAALLLHAACFLRLLHTEQVEVGEPPAD